MDLKQLRAFYLVGKHGTLLKVARHLNLTPPAISVQLKKLEGELMVRIFDRRPNKLLLTEKGRVLLKEVNHVFEALSRMREAIATAPDEYSGKLTVALGRDLARLFARQIAAFSLKHPRLRITIYSKASAEVVSLLLGGEIDIGISSFPKIPHAIEKRKLLDNKLYLVSPTTHPLSKKQSVSLADVAPYPLILHPRGTITRQVIDSGFSRHGIEIKNMVEIWQYDSIIEFVRAGLGVGIVHGICLPERQEKSIRSYEVTREFDPLGVYVIYKKSSISKLAHRAFIEALVSSTTKTRTRTNGSVQLCGR